MNDLSFEVIGGSCLDVLAVFLICLKRSLLNCKLQGYILSVVFFKMLTSGLKLDLGGLIGFLSDDRVWLF